MLEQSGMYDSYQLSAPGLSVLHTLSIFTPLWISKASLPQCRHDQYTVWFNKPWTEAAVCLYCTQLPLVWVMLSQNHSDHLFLGNYWGFLDYIFLSSFMCSVGTTTVYLACKIAAAVITFQSCKILSESITNHCAVFRHSIRICYANWASWIVFHCLVGNLNDFSLMTDLVWFLSEKEICFHSQDNTETIRYTDISLVYLYITVECMCVCVDSVLTPVVL